jgi:trimeric autotransporter adhesin
MKYSYVSKFILPIVVIFAATSAPAQQARIATDPAIAAANESVPRLVQFNSILKDGASRPVAGAASVTFAIYADQEGGAAIWSETQNVLADANGHYSAVLGAATSGGFPAELFGTGESRWLGVAVARQPEMPRALLASVPYALKAGDAQTLGGLPASSYVTTQQLAARSAIAVPSTAIVSAGGAGASSSNAAPSGTAATGNDALGDTAQSVTQAAVTGTGTANYLPLWTSGSNLAVSKIYQANGGFIGINTKTPLLQLDVNGNSIFRGSFQMAPQGVATAGAGQPSHSFQWQASLYDSSKKAAVNEAFGFRTVPATNNVANPSAKLDLFYGPGGGTLSDTGLSISKSGLITFAAGQIFNGASETVNQVNLPNTTSATTGVLNMGGAPILTNYGSTANVFLGNQSGGGFAASGGFNTAVGAASLYAIQTGTNNAAFGAYGLEENTTGSNNTAIGLSAMGSSVSTSNNTAVGYEALNLANGPGFDVGVGYQAGFNEATGSYNTFIGPGADAGTANSLTYATAIGAGAKVAESSSLILGGTGTFAVNVGINTPQPDATMEIVDRDRNSSGLHLVSTSLTDSLVYAENTATSGAGIAGNFQVHSPGGNAIYAENTSGVAALFEGDVIVTGKLTKGGGSFKIDDPIDPAGKYLSHSFVESPDMMNIYNGIVTLDQHGAAVVTMPEWFSALNRDFRYTLTAIGSPAPKIYVAEKMNGNRFKIAGGKRGQEISWMVTGIRQDAWANAHRIPNEEPKPANEQGKYLHPELFGAGPDQSIGAKFHPQSGAQPQNAAAAGADSGSDSDPGSGSQRHVETGQQ